MVCALGNYNTNLRPLTDLQVVLFNPFPPKSVMISKHNTNLDLQELCIWLLQHMSSAIHKGYTPSLLFRPYQL